MAWNKGSTLLLYIVIIKQTFLHKMFPSKLMWPWRTRRLHTLWTKCFCTHLPSWAAAISWLRHLHVCKSFSAVFTARFSSISFTGSELTERVEWEWSQIPLISAPQKWQGHHCRACLSEEEVLSYSWSPFLKVIIVSPVEFLKLYQGKEERRWRSELLELRERQEVTGHYS